MVHFTYSTVKLDSTEEKVEMLAILFPDRSLKVLKKEKKEEKVPIAKRTILPSHSRVISLVP